MTRKNTWVIYFIATGVMAVNALADISSPTEISDCVLWLDASMGVTSDANGVSQWDDQSDAGNDVTQSNDSYKPSITNGAFNGLDALRFETNNLSTTGVQLDISSTVFFVIKPDNITDKSTQRFAGHTGSSYYGQLRFNSGKLSGYFGDDRNQTSPHFPRASEVQILAYRFDDNVEHSLNGLPFAVADGSSKGFDPSRLRIGGDADGCAFNGEIAAVVVYDKVLTDSEASDVSVYLGKRYGIAGAVFNANTNDLIVADNFDYNRTGAVNNTGLNGGVNGTHGSWTSSYGGHNYGVGQIERASLLQRNVMRTWEAADSDYMTRSFSTVDVSDGDTIWVRLDVHAEDSTASGRLCFYGADQDTFGIGVTSEKVRLQFNGSAELTSVGVTDGHHTVLARLEFNASGSDEVLTYWIDPTDCFIGQTPNIYSETGSATADIGKVNIGTTVRTYTWGGHPNYDNLRIGTTVDSVIPDIIRPRPATVFRFR